MISIISLLDRYLKKSQNILELGCGDGSLITAIAKGGYGLKRIVASDFFNAPKDLPSSVAFVKQNLEEFDIQGPFDLVILHHVFEHVKDPLGLIEKIKKQLSEHGKIFIVVPNRYGLNNEARVYLPEHGKHYFLWDKESLEYSLNRLGFICRFHNLYAGASHPLMKYVTPILRIQNPHLICVAMKDVA